MNWTIVSTVLALSLTAAPAQEVRVYYFGNSLTGCSDPAWHHELGASAGKEWHAVASLGAGWQLWQHRRELQSRGVPLDRDSKDALTITSDQVADAKGRLRRFLTEKWDAIVLQPFSMGLTWKCEEMWGTEFGQETDVGDIASAVDIIEIYLRLNPRGRVFVYQNWPAMDAGEIPPDDEIPPWAQKMKERTGKLRRAEFPDRASFDYEKAWAEARYEPSPDPARFWLQKNARSKDYHDKVFAALKRRFPELWRAARLRVIPVGDIYLALHRAMKGGRFPGCTDVGEFYTDVQHIRQTDSGRAVFALSSGIGSPVRVLNTVVGPSPGRALGIPAELPAAHRLHALPLVVKLGGEIAKEEALNAKTPSAVALCHVHRAVHRRRGGGLCRR